MTAPFTPGSDRSALTAATFLELVDALVEDFDVIDMLTVLTARCVELLDASAAGILLGDEIGTLRVVAASNDEVELLELFQIQNDEGPCMDCYRTGAVVVAPNLNGASAWPRFAAQSVLSGFPSVCAVPLRLRSVVLGCLNMFMREPAALTDADVALAQSLADVASITIVQDQLTRESGVRELQLRHALESRISIEQAKGIIAARHNIDMHEAFTRLRKFARDNNRKLSDTAQVLIDGGITI